MKVRTANKVWSLLFLGAAGFWFYVAVIWVSRPTTFASAVLAGVVAAYTALQRKENA